MTTCNTICGSPPGPGSAAINSVVKLSSGDATQPVAAPSAIVSLPIVEIQEGSSLTGDGASSSIVVNIDGIYEITHAVDWGVVDPAADLDSHITVNGAPVELHAIATDSLDTSYTYDVLLRLSAGDVIQLVVEHDDESPQNIRARLWAKRIA